jgi:hypothetical protein
MADNTKMPPNQDQRQRKPPEAKPQKPGPVPTGTGPDRDRQGVNNPSKPMPEIDPGHPRPDRTKPIPDDLDDDERGTGPIDRDE